MNKTKCVVVTGGAGFIGANLVRYLLKNTDYSVVNVDKLTYAGNLESLADIQDNPKYHFEKIDICDQEKISTVFDKYSPDVVMHLAAESHVDRSIDGPAEFLNTNVLGTFNLLQVSLKYFNQLPAGKKGNFRFLHISTDEVFGSLNAEGYFSEETAYQPNSPYSASKASSDHFVRAWHHTFGLPTLITNCSNNYGPYQFPEKLIPVIILNAVQAKPLPVYGKGLNIRDWLYVEDHVRAMLTVVEKGRVGETYNIGARNEISNLELVKKICRLLDDMVDRPKVKGKKFFRSLSSLPAGGRIEATGTIRGQRFKAQGPRHEDLITFVTDRPGHDLRYAIDPSKIESELGWKPVYTFDQALEKTVKWYLDNRDWCEHIFDKSYRLERQGLGGNI